MDKAGLLADIYHYLDMGYKCPYSLDMLNELEIVELHCIKKNMDHSIRITKEIKQKKEICLMILYGLSFINKKYH